MDMTGSLRRAGAGALVGVAFLALTASTALGQGRGSVAIRNPGGIRSPGHSTSSGVSQFRSFSYGAGQVGSSGGGGGNVLQSRINTTMHSQLSSVVTRPTRSPLVSSINQSGQGYSRSAGGPITPTGGADPVSATRTVRRYTVTTPPVPGGGQSVGSMTAPTHTGPTGAYLQALTHRHEPSVLAQDEPIRSLAPKRPSMMRTMIRDGEKAFRDGDYNQAVKKFNLAYTLDSKSPEAALSLFHAQFATSKVSYGSADYLLSRTLRLLPELPLAPLDVRGFYGVPDDYDRHVGQLEQFVREHGGDPGAWLIVTYFRWFNGDISGAEAALASATDNAEQDHMIEALAIFADGIATGKARAAEQSAAEGDPVDPNAPDADPAGPTAESK